MLPANDQQQRSARPTGAVAPDPDLSCRLANVEWAVIAARLPWPNHLARIHDLEDAGAICDESYFAGLEAA